jgi:hypothetical protein
MNEEAMSDLLMGVDCISLAGILGVLGFIDVVVRIFYRKSLSEEPASLISVLTELAAMK